MSAVSPPVCPVPLTEKQQAIIAAATRIFLEQGYDQAGMEQIARAAGVAKQTLYNQFGNKEALFRAIITQRCTELLDTLHDSDPRDEGIEPVLTRFATTLLNILLEPSALALHRLIVAESRRLPRLGRLYYESGPQRGNHRLAEYLQSQCERGVLRIEDPELAARQFTGALLGALRTRALVLDEPIPQNDIDNTVRYTVQSFLARHLLMRT